MACYLGMEATKPLVNLVPEISGDLNSHNFDLENLRHLDLVPENPMFSQFSHEESIPFPLGPWAPGPLGPNLAHEGWKSNDDRSMS